MKNKTARKTRKVVAVKPPPPRKKFRLELIEKLQSLKIGKVEVGELSDGSSYWVDLKIKNKLLSFSFKDDGETLDGVNVYKEIKQVVDQKQIFGI